MNRRDVARSGVPAMLMVAAARRRAPRWQRAGATAALLAVWSAVYARYRRDGLAQTAREWEQLRTAYDEAFSLHYNERVPTIEEEFDLWGEYHRHRHEMRYDLVAAEARRLLPAGGVLLDIGSGSALMADRLLDADATYLGLDYGGHHVAYAAKKLAGAGGRLRWAVMRGDGEALPIAPGTVDVVVFSEVIEHLLRPERAVWELARVLRPGGHLVLTTNNASELPLRSPLSHALAWAEKMVAADHPGLMSLRPWVWPDPVDRVLLGLPEGAPDVYVPHTHHIAAESRALFAAAGLETRRWSTFEFPPPQSATAAFLDQRGEAGRRAVDLLEAVCRAVPGVRRLGCHLFVVARKTGAPVTPRPPRGVWPGPFSS